MMYLRQATASQAVVLGPFIDTDGAAVTGLTIDAADIRISINGGNIAAKNSGGATHDELGMYTATFDATDTATVGRMQVTIAETGALTVYHEFQILEEATFDMLFAASALGYVANAPVNVAQFGGSNGTFASGRPEVNASHWAGTAVGSTTVRADVINWGGVAIATPPAVNATQISGDSTAADNLELAFDNTAGAVPWLGIMDQGTAQSATATTLVLRSATPFASDDACLGATLWALGSDQGYWQARTITDYTTADDTATVATWDVTPSGTITYKIFGTAPASSGGSGATAQEVWEYGTRTVTSLAGITNLGWNSSWDAEVQSEVADALGVYDPPTNAEMEARTIAAASYATAANLTTVDTVVDAIKVKTDQLTFTVTGQVDANAESMNGAEILGDGTSGDKWRGE